MAKVKDFKSKFNARKETEKPKKVSKFSSFTENEAVEAVEEKEEKAEISAPAPASDISKTTKKIKMAFSKANYEYLSNASENLGVSKSYIINRLISTLDSEAVSGFISNMLIPPSKDIVSRKKGSPLARINIIFNSDTHSILSIEADKHNQTLTQYVNILLDFTRNK
ncbi:MAG: hypothetical protein SO022_12450 [Selenomonadaceae bacterium]|nr:hypothetical protein [Selenomonadaceae bacterium]